MNQENVAVNNAVVHLDDDDFEASVIPYSLKIVL